MPHPALGYPNYRWYILAVFTLTLSLQIQGTVVGWQVYAITGDPLALGLIGLAEALPFIATALYAGHVADRRDRRRITLGALWVLVGCSVALLALARAGTGRTALSAIYAVIVVSGVARAFLQAARSALAAELVPRDVYPNAIAWRSGVWQLGAVIGPAVGGVLYAWRGAVVAYAVDAALLVVALGAVLAIRHRTPARDPGATSVTESLTAGLRYVFATPVVLGALSLDLFAVLFGGAVALLPIFANEILHVGPQGLGALRAAPAVGAVVMSAVIAWRPPQRRLGVTLLGAVAAFGVAMIGFALSTAFWLSMALLVVSGAVDMVSVFVRQSLVQTLTPEHLLGRVSAVNSVFIGSSNEIGMFESGVAAKLLGVVRSVVFGGAMTLVVVAATAWGNPPLRRLDRLEGAR